MTITTYTPVVVARDIHGKVRSSIAISTPSIHRLAAETVLENADSYPAAVDARSFLIRAHRHENVTITTELRYDTQ